MQTVEELLTDPNAPASSPLPEPPTAAESSRLLLELIELSQQARACAEADARTLEGIISPVILRRLLATLHFRDLATVQHSRRVSQLAVGIARHLRWEGADLRRLEIAALLHDLGKIGVPDNILFKPGKLNPDESDLMDLHHRVSVDALQAARVDAQVTQFIAESRDFTCAGARRPAKAPGTLHLGARILSVADAYDSLRTDQVYRKAKSHEDAMRILVESTGTQFDGNVINGLLRWAGACGLNRSTEYHTETLPESPGQIFVDPQEARDADSLSRIFGYLYLLENLYDGFYLVDADLRFVVWNSGAQSLIGQPPQQLLDRPWSSRIICYADENGRDLEEDEIPLRQVLESRRASARDLKILNHAGCWVDVELQTVPLMDAAGNLRGAAEIIRDRSRAELAPREYRDLKLSASQDPLTGVANRTEIRTQFTQMLETANREDWKIPSSVICVEIDHFKQINDRFGDATGDLALIEVARLLQQETYSGEIVGRNGGGQFIIFCPNTVAEQANKRAERIRLVISRLHLNELEDWPLTASFGVTQAIAGDSADSVLCRADKALYSAVQGGRDQTFFLSASEHAEPLLREGTGNAAFEFEAQFLACTAAEMIVYKLGGFVNQHDADLLEVTPERVRMKLGRTGLLSSWGKTNERRPIEVDLDFGSEAPIRDVNGRKVKSNQIRVSVKIIPIGRIKDRDIFLERARQVLKDLSTYFLAEV